MNHPQVSDPYVLGLIDEVRRLAREAHGDDTLHDATAVGEALWDSVHTQAFKGVGFLVDASRLCGRLEEWCRIFCPRTDAVFVGYDTLHAWIYCVATEQPE